MALLQGGSRVQHVAIQAPRSYNKIWWTLNPKPSIAFLVFVASREHALGEGRAGPTTQELRSGQMLLLTVSPLSLRVSGLGCEANPKPSKPDKTRNP